MIIDKVTTGFVIQSYDTDAQKFTDQRFIAGDEVDYEVGGDAVNVEDWIEQTNDAYLPFEMKQP